MVLFPNVWDLASVIAILKYLCRRLWNVGGRFLRMSLGVLFGPRILPLVSWQKHVSYISLLSMSFIWVYGRLYFEV